MDVKNLTNGTKFSFRYFGELIQGEVFNNGKSGLLLGFNCAELNRPNPNTNNKYSHNYAINTSSIESFLKKEYLTDFKIECSSTFNLPLTKDIINNQSVILSKEYYPSWMELPSNSNKVTEGDVYLVKDSVSKDKTNALLPDIKKRKLSPLSTDL